MSDSQPWVFMGGTFDPVHNGHLRTALEIQQWLVCDQVHLIPSRSPVHRDEPGCTARQRYEMLALAVEDEPLLSVDAREIDSQEPSYTLNTLRSLRQELGEQRSLVMVMGVDAYLTLPTWRQWDTFLSLCHIIVVSRPGYHFHPEGAVSELTRKHRIGKLETLSQRPCGGVMIHELTPLGISATQIRALIAQGQSPRYLMPDRVWHYIQRNKLYGFK